MNTKQMNAFRNQLTKAKATIEKRLEHNEHFNLKQGHFHESMGELSSYDNHPADEGSALYEREKDIALHEHTEDELDDINEALEAMDNGTYGKCKTCGEDIPTERLEALPTAAYCIEHSPDQSVSRQRPIEEEVLKPPFGQFEFDEKDAEVYDVEDSWQEVAKWGTSNSPSDFTNPPDQYEETYIESEEPIGYVEDYENFIGNDMEGKNIQVFPNEQHEKYEDALDEEGFMTSFGDLKPYEEEPYTDEKENKH